MKRLHLGCGEVNFGKTWEHIDNIDLPHVKSKSIYPLPHDDNSVNIIYASHVLEYFPLSEIILVLKHWHDKLKPKGILRLAVPDFGEMAKLYAEGMVKIPDIIWPITGKLDDGEGGEIYHKTIWDIEQLARALDISGFEDIKEWNWRSTSPHNKHKDASRSNRRIDGKRVSISLNLEAKKP